MSMEALGGWEKDGVNSPETIVFWKTFMFCDQVEEKRL